MLTPVNSTNSNVFTRTESNFVYTPSANYNGNDSFTWNAQDGESYANQSANANLTVAADNDSPTSVDFDFTTPYETAYLFNTQNPALFETSFTDLDFQTQGIGEFWELVGIVIDTLPSNGVLSVDAGNGRSEITSVGTKIAVASLPTLEYTPNSGATGSDSFAWRGVDNPDFFVNLSLAPQDLALLDISNASTANITILNPNDAAPTADGFTITTEFNQPYSFTIPEFEENYDDPDGDPLEAVVIVTSPSQGELLYQGSPYAGQTLLRAELGELVYQPNPGFVGSDVIEYRVIANQVTSQTAVIGVTVTDYQPVQIVLTADTPSEEVTINKEVCIEAQITNPNSFALENVVVRLTTHANKAPFILGSYQVPIERITGEIQDTSTDFLITLARVAGQETVQISNCALPQVPDLSIIDGVTFLQGSDRVTEDEVELDPPESVDNSELPQTVTQDLITGELVRTGGNSLSLTLKAFVAFLAMGIGWILKRLHVR